MYFFRDPNSRVGWQIRSKLLLLLLLLSLNSNKNQQHESQQNYLPPLKQQEINHPQIELTILIACCGSATPCSAFSFLNVTRVTAEGAPAFRPIFSGTLLINS